MTLAWRTASELDLAGFNVYRVRAGKSIKLNHTLVQARSTGKASGAAYSLADRSVQPGSTYVYRLQTVALSGRRAWAGASAIRLHRR